MPALPMPAVYLGVDPGKSGGIAFVGTNGGIMTFQMPETEREVYKAVSFYRTNAVAVIERVHSSPQMGVTSAFTFGQGYGFLRGCLVAAGIPFQEVTPQTWMKGLGIPVRKRGTDKKQGKLQLLKVAQQLFPNLSLWNEPKSKGRQLAVCDALLIAEFCRRTNG